MIRALPATPESNERVFALLELMLSLRTRPSLSDARTVPKPDHLGPFGAGWRALPTSRTRTRSSARHSRLGRAELRIRVRDVGEPERARQPAPNGPR